MRSIALDVHQSFCEVAIREAGKTRSAGRIKTDRAELELFARSLDAEWALGSDEVRRLMTIPGVGLATAVTLVAAIGEISRFASPRKLVAYLGLDPKVRQSGEEAPRHGRISKRGNAQARSALVEAAWVAIRSPGPLRAFGERIRARRGAQVAAVAVARKLAALAWQLLSKGEDYAYGRPSLLRSKLRAAELAAGSPRLPRRHDGERVRATASERNAERGLAERGEAAYRRLVADWRASGAERRKAGTGAPSGRASKAARQGSAPGPAL